MRKVQLNGSEVGERDHPCTKTSSKHAHDCIVEFRGVSSARLEFKSATENITRRILGLVMEGILKRVGIAILPLPVTPPPYFSPPLLVTSNQTSKSQEHFAEWRVNIVIKLSLDVIGSKFSKMRLIPNNKVSPRQFVEARKEGQGCEDEEGRDMRRRNRLKGGREECSNKFNNEFLSPYSRCLAYSRRHRNSNSSRDGSRD